MRGKHSILKAILATGILSSVGCAAPIRNIDSLPSLPQQCDISAEQPDCPRGVYLKDDHIYSIGCAQKGISFDSVEHDHFGTRVTSPSYLNGKTGSDEFAEGEAILNARGYVPDNKLVRDSDYMIRKWESKNGLLWVAYKFEKE